MAGLRRICRSILLPRKDVYGKAFLGSPADRKGKTTMYELADAGVIIRSTVAEWTLTD